MKVGVLFFHGFTGGPYEIQPFIDYVAKRTNWVLSVPTLTGHGEWLQLEHPNAVAERWISEAIRAYRHLQKRVDRIYVVGFSMGGLLAIYLAAQFRVDKLILLSAAARFIHIPQLARNMKQMMNSPQRQDEESAYVPSFTYKIVHTPERAVLQFLRVWQFVRTQYRNVTCPVRIVHGKEDGIVPLRAAFELERKLQSKDKEVIVSLTAKHHVCYSRDRDGWFPHLLHFLKEID